MKWAQQSLLLKVNRLRHFEWPDESRDVSRSAWSFRLKKFSIRRYFRFHSNIATRTDALNYSNTDCHVVALLLAMRLLFSSSLVNEMGGAIFCCEKWRVKRLRHFEWPDASRDVSRSALQFHLRLVLDTPLFSFLLQYRHSNWRAYLLKYRLPRRHSPPRNDVAIFLITSECNERGNLLQDIVKS